MQHKQSGPYESKEQAEKAAEALRNSTSRPILSAQAGLVYGTTDQWVVSYVVGTR